MPAVNSQTETFNLAIETSSRYGSIVIGSDQRLIEAVDLGTERRHVVQMLQQLDDLCQHYGFQPRQLKEVYLSIGPGSFTGLRVAVMAAKMLGTVVGAKLVPVPTLDVVVENVHHRDHVAVCLDARRGSMFTAVYRRHEHTWQSVSAPALWTPQQLVDHTEGPMAIVADHLPEFDWPRRFERLHPQFAVPLAVTVWRLGRERADAGGYVSPAQLQPHYIRLPEAEERRRAGQIQ